MNMSHKFSSKKAAIESKLPSFEITFEKDPEYQDALAKDREEQSDQHPHSVKTCYVDSYFEEIAVHLGNLENEESETEIVLGRKMEPPHVGAVVVFDGVAYCAKRSAFKHGDHAEHSVLDTMLGDADLREKGAVLYGTLEPCTKQSRSKWTTSCTELIIARGIRKVFVGSLDNNPLVEGQGIGRLLQEGVEVHFFKPGFANQCRHQNDSFRAQFSNGFAKEIKAVGAFLRNRLDWPAVSFYCRRRSDAKAEWLEAGAEDFGSDALWRFYAEMIETGYLSSDGKSCKLSDDFSLCFLKDPSEFVSCFEVDFLRPVDAESSGNEPTERIGASIIRLMASDGPDSLLASLAVKVAGRVPDGGLEAFVENVLTERCRLPKKMDPFKEAAFNALVHHAYRSGSPIVFLIKRDGIAVNNCAARLSEEDALTLENEGWPSLPANPRLMQLLVNCGLVQRSGRGLPSIREVASISVKGYQDWSVIQVAFPKEAK